MATTTVVAAVNVTTIITPPPITTTATTNSSTNKGFKKPKLKPERYYLILKAILSGYRQSSCYHQKLTNDPRPIQQTIGALSGVHFQVLRRDLKHLIDNGLVKCYVDERKSVFTSSARGRKKRKPIRTYEVTNEGHRYLEEYGKLQQQPH